MEETDFYTQNSYAYFVILAEVYQIQIVIVKVVLLGSDILNGVVWKTLPVAKTEQGMFPFH